MNLESVSSTNKRDATGGRGIRTKGPATLTPPHYTATKPQATSDNT